MRAVMAGGLIALAVMLGPVVATAQTAEQGGAGSGKAAGSAAGDTWNGGLGKAPPSQGEAWMGSTGTQDPTLGQRRTDQQKNAVETRQQGRTGTIPDTAHGESGLKGEGTGSAKP